MKWITAGASVRRSVCVCTGEGKAGWDETKLAAAKRSMDFIEDGMRLGIGSGTTLRYVVEQLSERVRGGLKIVGVPTSHATGKLAASHGIPLATFEEVQVLDLAIDEADEIGPELALMKGGGGQLLHERAPAAPRPGSHQNRRPRSSLARDAPP